MKRCHLKRFCANLKIEPQIDIVTTANHVVPIDIYWGVPKKVEASGRRQDDVQSTAEASHKVEASVDGF